MSDKFSFITPYFERLQPREKFFMAIGALMVLGIALIKALLPLGQNYSELVRQKQGLETDLLWLQQQRDTVTKLANNCPVLRHQQYSQSSIVSQLVRRNQWQVDSLNDSEGIVSLSITGTDSNRLLQLIHQIACYGYVIDNTQITRADNDSFALKAVLEFHSVD